MVVLIFVTAVVITANVQVHQFMTNEFKAFNITNSTSPIAASMLQAYGNLNGILPQFNYYLLFIFFAVFIASTLSTIFLNANPLNWLIAAFAYIPIYYISLFVANISHALLSNPLIASGVAALPADIYFAAYLPIIVGIFAGLYIFLLALRVIFFSPVAAGNGNSGLPRPT
ncbi:MAG: hypothetical protein QXG73_01950 [Candidatus Micrarchaeaceae archaeon]